MFSTSPLWKVLVNGESFTLCTDYFPPLSCLAYLRCGQLVRWCVPVSMELPGRVVGKLRLRPLVQVGERRDGPDRAMGQAQLGGGRVQGHLRARQTTHTHLSDGHLNGLCVVLCLLRCVVFYKVCDFISKCCFMKIKKRIHFIYEFQPRSFLGRYS